jgi:hypothetical protein
LALPTRRKVFDIAGESHRTLDGRDRQDILRQCVPGERVTLQRQPSNPHDSNAILVSVNGADIGFICREDAPLVAPLLDEGRSYHAQLHELRGGFGDYSLYGCRISITWDEERCPNLLL